MGEAGYHELSEVTIDNSKAEGTMANRIATVEDLLQRSASNRSEATQIDQRSHLALELIADALIAVLAELKESGRADVTSIASM